MNLKIKPILDKQTAEYVLKQAQVDGHLLIQPTHYVEKDSQLIGGFNLAQLPTVNFWMHTQRANAKDSLITFNVVENLIQSQGKPFMSILVSKDSPFRPFMEKLGYQNLGSNFDVMIKLF